MPAETNGDDASAAAAAADPPVSLFDQRPSLPRSSSFGGFISRQSERSGDEWGGGTFILLDVIETFFDSRLDLFERRLKEQSARLKNRAVELLPRGLRTPGGGGILILDDDDYDQASAGAGVSKKGERYKREVEREVERIKVKLAAKVTQLSSSWRSAQIVRTREKVSFLFGVCTLSFTCLLFGRAPEWIPFAYTAQCAFYLPTRVYAYKRKDWHYFLFGDLCYFVNILDLLWLWIMPSSTVLFICCYLLTMGPLASAIVTWRNSLVFHSLDKVTSLFIHIYPPIVFSVILFNYENASQRYPALAHVADYSWFSQIVLAAVPYCLWQAAYYKFISIDRKAKVESGQRQNSFHYLLNDKRGPIGRALRGITPEHREQWFIFGQLVYSIVFMIPPAALLIHSATATNIFLVTIFVVSVWNGATFYVEVFGRKFERELERLRKEMELASSTAGSTTSGNPTPSAPSTPYANYTSSVAGSLEDVGASPLILPGARESAVNMEVPEFVLDKAAEEVGEHLKSD